MKAYRSMFTVYSQANTSKNILWCWIFITFITKWFAT